MINTYIIKNNSIVKNSEHIINESTIWIDLFNITDEEKREVKNLLNFEIPTLQEISQIEISERLYIENNTLYLTMTELVNRANIFPETHSILYILHKNILITIRYTELISFDCSYINKNLQRVTNIYTSKNILYILLRNMVTKLSNVVQSISTDIDNYGKIILDNNINDLSVNYTDILKKIGQTGDLLSKCRECLFSLTMALQYLLKSPTLEHEKQYKELLNTLLTDVDSIINFSQFISSEISRTLDATLGMVAIEQNNIIKIFSIMTIFFLPPTLIASIYGMNFVVMPELKLTYGYPATILVMICSIIITYKYFKKKKWL